MLLQCTQVTPASGLTRMLFSMIFIVYSPSASVAALSLRPRRSTTAPARPFRESLATRPFQKHTSDQARRDIGDRESEFVHIHK